MSIQSVVIIGSGNVATHLGNVFKQGGFHIDVVYSRDQHKAAKLANMLGAIPYSQLDLLPTHADLYLIAVKDSAIEEVANKLPLVNGLVVHTSGTTPLTVLQKHKHAGVFYPLQSLSKNNPVSITDIPVLIEAKQESDISILESLAKKCGTTSLSITSEDRQIVHLAAIFANNFSNYMYTIAEQILGTKGISIDILKPLILETARKVQHNSPSEVQTGPAIRNDIPTMEMHIKLMEMMPKYRRIYETLSKGIQEV
jgi:predicted short-subunit dehydrogenase-like oxidoreductase (DUF2520 family)